MRSFPSILLCVVVTILESGGLALAADSCLPSEDANSVISNCGKVIQSSDSSERERYLALHNRAIAFLRSGFYEQAIADFRAQLGMFPGAQTFVDLGRAYNLKMDYKDAIGAFDFAISLDPRNGPAYAGRGDAYSGSGDKQKALEDYKEALRRTLDYHQLAPDVTAKIAALESEAAAEVAKSNGAEKASGQIPQSSTLQVPIRAASMNRFSIQASINNSTTMEFMIDTGATTVTVSEDVFQTLLRTGTLKQADLRGKKSARLANGELFQTDVFNIDVLKVGNREIRNVIASTTGSKGELLLGQSFFRRFKSWSIDNQRNTLTLD